MSINVKKSFNSYYYFSFAINIYVSFVYLLTSSQHDIRMPRYEANSCDIKIKELC